MRASRGDSVVVVVAGFLAAQAAWPEPIVTTARATMGAKGRRGIPEILSNTNNSYNDRNYGRRRLRTVLEE
jgi:hypothetical protein